MPFEFYVAFNHNEKGIMRFRSDKPFFKAGILAEEAVLTNPTLGHAYDSYLGSKSSLLNLRFLRDCDFWRL